MSTAGHTAGTGGRAGFTGKQVVFSAITCTDSIAVQHVKQSYETSFMTAMEGARDINLRFRVYPKPASDFLIIDAENSEMEKLYFLLYDFSSKLMVY
ncbi:MAG TPA: hypothetical protein PKW80_10975 [Bacteroidales bacterium]|nr:hypothetical protein [Bacteroidales bacterium]